MSLLILSVLIFMQILCVPFLQGGSVCVCGGELIGGGGGGESRVGSVTMTAQSYSKNSR